MRKLSPWIKQQKASLSARFPQVEASLIWGDSLRLIPRNLPNMSRPSFSRMLVKFCQQRAPTFLVSHDIERFQAYLLELLADHMSPPKTGGDYDWYTIAGACGIDHADLKRAARALAPGLDALSREIARQAAAARLLLLWS